MISKHAINQFLRRDLDSYNWIKKESLRSLFRELREEYPVKYKFSIKPYKHQLACWQIGTSLDNFLFFLDMGAGKTFLSLSIFDYRKILGEVDTLLVVVPNENNIYGWKEEVEKFTPHLRYQSLYADKNRRIDILEKSNADVYVINYAGLLVMMTELVKAKKGKKRTLIPDHIDWFCQFFDMVVFDESQFLKNVGSTVTQAAMEMSERIPYRYAMTGTPMQNVEDLWSQFYIIDRGETLGSSYDIFYHSFFRQVTNPFGTSWEFDSRKRRQLYRIIQHRSIRYLDREFTDLPLQQFTNVPVVMSKQQLKAYKDMLKNFIKNEETGDKTSVENSYIKLRQIASGWVKVKDEIETDEGIEEVETYIDYPDNPKIEEMKELVRKMPSDSKMVIFYHFTHSGNQIMKALKELKIKAVRFYSGTKDKENTLNTFKNDDDCYVAVAQLKSASTGLNLQHANYMVYYELPDSLITYKQSLKRIHRSGQKKTCHYYYLMSKGSVDYRVKDSLEAGEELMTQILQGTAKRADFLQDLES